MGMRPEFAGPQGLAKSVRTSDTRNRRQAVTGGRLLVVVLLKVASAAEKRDGWVQPGGFRVTRQAVKTGKSLQWIERQKLSPSPN